MNVTVSVNQDEMIVKTPHTSLIKDLKVLLQLILSYKNQVLSDNEVISSKMARDGLVLLGTNQPNFGTVIPKR